MDQEQKIDDNSAKFVFFYLLSLVALVFTSLSTGMIIFQVINKYVPDPLGNFGQGFSSGPLRFAIAALIVAGPLFFLTTRHIYKNLFKGALDKDANVRKVLTYFLLLVSSLMILGWLIGLISNYLGGELTIKFILQAITCIGIAAIVFTFYLHDIRREKIVGQKDRVVKMYFFGSLMIIIAAFVSALLVVESPQQARDRKLDNAILDDFDAISNGLNDYYNKNQKLPATLEELKSEVLFVIDENLKDPSTAQFYEYKIVADRRYQLCAVFRISNVDDQDMNSQFYREKWPHKAGTQCIEQGIEQNKEQGY